MAGQSFAMFGWSWTEVSVLGSQVFGQDLMESCGLDILTSARYVDLDMFCKIKCDLFFYDD